MGVDEFINESVAPLSSLISKVVFFTVPVLDADVPLVVVWLVRRYEL